MVAKITVPKGIRRALNYNEQKAKEGKAECIYAHRFLKEADRLNFHDKLEWFQSLINKNKRASTNSVHISLNFRPDEKLEREKIAEIARTYMQKVGFDEQPYLVYHHMDAGHPHIHIVSTNIQRNGRRISLHNIGRNQSTVARKEIETIFGLKKAVAQEMSMEEKIKPVNARKLIYGRSELKRSITIVLDEVLSDYKFASLPELNAILKLYNLTADRGMETGMIFRKGGLVYRALDEFGNKIGVPIKASSVYSKPTLAYLEEKFKYNGVAKQEFRKNLRTSIDWVMLRSPKDFQAFKVALEKERIGVVARQNEQGMIYGLTYIDHNTKCVFNGSEIGKEYSANAVLEKFGVKQMLAAPPQVNQTILKGYLPEQTAHQDRQREVIPMQLIEDVVSPSEELHSLPYELTKRKKKKKKSNQ